MKKPHGRSAALKAPVDPTAPRPKGTITASGNAGPDPAPIPPRPFSMHGRLFLGEKREEQWSIADPTDERSFEALRTIYHQVFTGFPNPQPETLTVSRADLQRVISLAEAWIHLGTYELGIGVVSRQLREVRAALRKMGRAQ